MQKPNSALLLVGSPKGPNSSSNSLGSYLLEKLQTKGLTTKTIYLSQNLASDQKHAALLEQVDQSDLIILAFPLYIDSLHSHVIKTLELIADHRKASGEPAKKTFMAIINSGFPEATQNQTALNICRLFARDVGFDWAGGLAMGGGGMIGGLPLSELGGRIRNQTRALELAADALANGEPVPAEAAGLMSKLGIPHSLYVWMGNRGWKQQAKKHIPIDSMYRQPCKEA
jgi:hypothetical protein